MFFAGKNGSVQVGASQWKLADWNLDVDTDSLDVTNFQSGGFKENIAGLTGGSVSLSGPYDTGAMAMTSGSTYTVTLTVGGSVSFAVPVRIKKLNIKTDVKGFAQVQVQGDINGSFTAAIA